MLRDITVSINPSYPARKDEGRCPQVILAGRAINDSMPRYVATMAVKGLNKEGRTTKRSNVLIMGSHKEDLPYTRESPAENMVPLLTGHLHSTQIMPMQKNTGNKLPENVIKKLKGSKK